MERNMWAVAIANLYDNGNKIIVVQAGTARDAVVNALIATTLNTDAAADTRDWCNHLAPDATLEDIKGFLWDGEIMVDALELTQTWEMKFIQQVEGT